MVNGWRGLELEVLKDKGTPLVAISALFAYRVALFACLESLKTLHGIDTQSHWVKEHPGASCTWVGSILNGRGFPKIHLGFLGFRALGY